MHTHHLLQFSVAFLMFMSVTIKTKSLCIKKQRKDRHVPDLRQAD